MKILIVSLSLLSIAWTTHLNVKEPIAQKPKAPLVKHVLLKDIILNKGKYQGQLIQTEGYFIERFEERAIYNDKKLINARNPTTAVWIYFSATSKRRFNLDSISTKLITVRGILDTVRKGHCDAYPCSLVNADLISFK